MADLGLQVTDYALCFRQGAFGFFPGGGFGRQSSLGALQAAAGRRRNSRRGAAMDRGFMSLVAPQDRDRNIAVLHEAPAMQAAIEPVTETRWLIHPFRFRAMARRFAEQAERPSHLGFGIVVWGSVTRRSSIRRT